MLIVQLNMVARMNVPIKSYLSPTLHFKHGKIYFSLDGRSRSSILIFASLLFQIFFTRNGKIVGQRQICIPKGGFYPTVGMLSSCEKVKVDLRPLTG